MNNISKRPRRISLVSLIVLIITLFCIVLILLFRRLYLVQVGVEDGIRVERFYLHRETKFGANSVKGLTEKELNITLPLKKKYIWIVKANAGVFLRPSTKLNRTGRSAFLPYRTLVYGKRYAHSSGPEKHLLLLIEYPFFGWIPVSSISALSLPSTVIQMKKKSSEEITAEKICSNESLVLHHKDYTGGDLSGIENPLKAATHRDCCIMCLKNPQCNHWSYTLEQDCWLKGITAQQFPVEKVGITSGQLPSDIIRPEFPKHSTDLITQKPLVCEKTPILVNTEMDVIPEVPISVISFIDKEKAFPPSSTHLISLALTGNWEEQWPIGNGKFGAFIHGNLQFEVNPFSVNDFFVLKPPPPASNADGIHLDSKEKYFQQARQEYLTGHFQKADKIIANFHRLHNLGMFQYLFDFAFLFSKFPLVFLSTDSNQPQLRKRNPDFYPFMNFHGRRNRIERIRHFFRQLIANFPQQSENQQNPNQPAPFHLFNHILESQSHLDTKSGITFASYLHRRYLNDAITTEAGNLGGAPSGNMSVDYIDEYHHREWFASSVDEMIYGKLRCRELSQENSQDIGCLNVAFEVSREIPLELHQSIGQVKEIQSLDEYLRKNPKINLHPEIPIARSFIVNYNFQSSGDNIVPFTNVLMLVSCDSSDFSYHISSEDKNQDKGSKKRFEENDNNVHVFICNRATELSIMISAEKIDNLGKSRDELSKANEDDKDKILKNSQQRFHQLLRKGWTRIRFDHIENFQKEMKSVSFNFDYPSNFAEKEISLGSKEFCSPIFTNLVYSQGFGKSFAELFTGNPALAKSTPANIAEQTMIKYEDYRLTAQLYNYGRYLLVSSANQSVTNLQGLWADGLSSSWNGDYHLNINLQMNYWAIFPTQTKNAFHPLINFVEQLAKKGSITAEQMYNIEKVAYDERKDGEGPPWVSHGFTDSSLHSFPNGENQWSLCVSCGAWIANHLFDLIVYEDLDQIDDKLIEERILPIYRGLIRFYKQHLFRTTNSDESKFVVHTGPTTSPENSYIVVLENSDKSYHSESLQVLTLSPAIDVSILRQLSNGFNLLIKILMASDRKKKLIRENDILLGQEFKDLIFHLPNQALPEVDSKHDGSLIKEYPDPYFELSNSLPKAEGPSNGDKPNPPLAKLAFPPSSSEMKIKTQSQPRNLLPVTPDLWKELGDAFDQINSLQQESHHEIEKLDLLEEKVVKNRRQLIFSQKEDVNVDFVEDIDYGHRHFSLLHWLYPNPFLPFVHSNDSRDSSRDVYSAALKTLYNKYKNKGGHTNWSIIWQISLLARLSGYDSALSKRLPAQSEVKSDEPPQREESSQLPISQLIQILMQKFFSHYLTNNYLTLHPLLDQERTVVSAVINNGRRLDHELPLSPVMKNVQNKARNNLVSGKSFQCETCFTEHVDDISSRIFELVPFRDMYFRYQRKSTLDETDITEELSPPSAGSQANTLDQMLSQLQMEKGFVTKNNGKFQIDANFGYLASIHELIVQSFIPNVIHLFPVSSLFLYKSETSIPVQGKIEGFALPGNGKIKYLEWFTGNIHADLKQGINLLLLEIDLYHFWWRRNFVKEEFGFYDIDLSTLSDHEAEIQIYSPNELEVVGEDETSKLLWLKEEHLVGGGMCKPIAPKPGGHDAGSHGSYFDTVTKDKHGIIIHFDLSKDTTPNRRCFILLRGKGS